MMACPANTRSNDAQFSPETSPRGRGAKTGEAICLSALLLLTVISAAVAQERLTTRLYDAERTAWESVMAQDATAREPAPLNVVVMKKKGALSKDQYEEVLQFAEKLLRLQRMESDMSFAEAGQPTDSGMHPAHLQVR